MCFCEANHPGGAFTTAVKTSWTPRFLRSVISDQPRPDTVVIAQNSDDMAQFLAGGLIDQGHSSVEGGPTDAVQTAVEQWHRVSFPERATPRPAKSNLDRRLELDVENQTGVEFALSSFFVAILSFGCSGAAIGAQWLPALPHPVEIAKKPNPCIPTPLLAICACP
jgi:hypothetical protein